MDRAKRYSRSPSTAWQRIGSELVVLDLKGNKIMGLNETGALLWEMADGGTDLEAMIRALSDRFGVERERAEADVLSFMSLLAAKGLVVTEKAR